MPSLTNWTKCDIGSGVYNTILNAGNTFVLGGNKKITFSHDGMNWTSVPIDGNVKALYYFEGEQYFLAAGDNGLYRSAENNANYWAKLSSSDRWLGRYNSVMSFCPDSSNSIEKFYLSLGSSLYTCSINKGIFSLTEIGGLSNPITSITTVLAKMSEYDKVCITDQNDVYHLKTWQPAEQITEITNAVSCSDQVILCKNGNNYHWNGTSWEMGTPIGDGIWTSIQPLKQPIVLNNELFADNKSGNEMYLALSSDGNIAYSVNGIFWQRYSYPIGMDMAAVGNISGILLAKKGGNALPFGGKGLSISDCIQIAFNHFAPLVLSVLSLSY